MASSSRLWFLPDGDVMSSVLDNGSSPSEVDSLDLDEVSCPALFLKKKYILVENSNVALFTNI